MLKRIAGLAGTLLIAIGAGIGIGLLSNSPPAKATIAAAAAFVVWALVATLGGNGDIWKFDAPYR